jgi:pyruvate dehydrogenase E2 component (dihydrolipoamide acetyltransferase)
MARSKREIPHYYLSTPVDLEPVLTWLADHNAPLPAAKRVLPVVPILKAVALAARQIPDLNGHWVDDGFRPSEHVHLGVAVSLRRGGLLAPAIHDTDQLSIDELMAALRDVVARTRAGGLRGSELNDPTLTVSNLGDQGVDVMYAVIHPPQVAIVGVGATRPRPWAVGDALAVRRVVDLTLSADHRATDGHLGARFLAAVAAHLAEPEML